MFVQAFRAWENLTHLVTLVLCEDAQENQDLSTNTRQHLETSASTAQGHVPQP